MDFGELFQQAGFVVTIMVLVYLTARLVLSNIVRTNLSEDENQRLLINLASKAIESVDNNTKVINELNDYIKHMDKRRQEMQAEVLKAASENKLILNDVFVITSKTHVLVNDINNKLNPPTQLDLVQPPEFLNK